MANQDIRPARPDASTSAPRAADGGAGPEVADPGLRVTELQEQVTDLERQVAELEDRWRRALADLDNLRKRYERDSAQQRARERAQVAAAWLPVVDHLELALAHATANPAAIIDGVRGVRDQALAVLAGLGYPRRDDLGSTFDPARHEAVAATPAPHVPAGTVLEVVRPGYGEGEQQLRPAAVVVAAAPVAPDGVNGDGGDRRDAGAR
ncbi:nucleotide exchange factor GrpE [Geodermatophilus sp. DSM 44513]|uniref:nucleotide exchange factor GrpE n=1 Tax=Geodermatophilus sp. DSM 44513 TaxID=1528104 RepID=UPI0028F71DB8|nr:nucleotide exchange factor GrpE [Geodermatophilus sp. DSM 44513]WNV75230.1 nucleotide exchange factor GrpE [Geodermatophilus sp. DSM 44513]